MNTDIFQQLASRASVRKFTSAAVPCDLLERLLAAAMQAPNTGNMQQYSVVISADEEQKAALAPAHFSQPAATGCAAMLTFCVDFNRFEHWCKISDATPGYNNFQAFLWGVVDTVIFAQQFNTLAENAGLGCCYLGTTTYNAPDIARILDLPNRVVPVVTLAVGYPASTPQMSDRLPASAIIHREKYHHYTDDDIRECYAAKEALEENSRFVAENGKKSLAQVFTDVRYPESANSQFSAIYLDMIEKCGFNLPSH